MSQYYPEFLPRYQTIPTFQTKAELNRSNCHKCENCVYEDVDIELEPCNSCCWVNPPNKKLESNWEYRFLIEPRNVPTESNWQLVGVLKLKED